MTPSVWVKATTLAVAAGLVLIPGYSQNKGGGTPITPPAGTGTPTPGTGTGTTGRTNTSIPNTNNPNNTQNPNAPAPLTQPIFVSGRVALEDGSPLPEPVTIETVCNGAPHGEGYTDAKGYFGIELGSRNSAMIQDAAEYSSMGNRNTSMAPIPGGGTSSTPTSGPMSANMGDRKYMGCDLQAKLAGYRSQQVSLTGRRPMDDPNVGTILLHRMGGSEEGQTVSMVSLAAPKDAKKAYDRGMEAIKKKKWDEAEKNFEKAVEEYPRYATAWYELGMLQAGQSRFDMARSYFKRALECDGKFLKPYLQIAVLDMNAKKWQDLADVTDNIVKLDPFGYPQAYFYNGVANYNLHNMDEAEKSGLQAERLDTRHLYPRLNYLLGLVLVQRKDYRGAAERFKTYLKLDPEPEDVATVRSQLAAIEKVTASAAAAKDHDQ